MKHLSHIYKGYRSDGYWIDIGRLCMTEEPDIKHARKLAVQIKKSKRFRGILAWGVTTSKEELLDPDAMFDIEDGHHRLLAAKLLGLDKVPVIIGDWDRYEEQ